MSFPKWGILVGSKKESSSIGDPFSFRHSSLTRIRHKILKTFKSLGIKNIIKFKKRNTTTPFKRSGQ
jgi:hypothetical protein